MDNTAYALTRFKLLRVTTINYGGKMTCRCPNPGCGAPVTVDKKGVIRCVSCGQLFAPENK